MFWVYIIESTRTGKRYYGQTQDLHVRMEQHNAGKVGPTRSHRPWKIVGVFRFETRAEAMEFEMKLKKAKNKAYIQWLLETRGARPMD